MDNLPQSEAQWRQRLSPEQYRILREHGTERAFTGLSWDEKRPGDYRCAGCDTLLFASDAKFDSGSGWPSFTRPVAPDVITEHHDTSHGMRRIEARCATCGGHLGHVFPDGPREAGGLRYCINSAAMGFVPSAAG